MADKNGYSTEQLDTALQNLEFTFTEINQIHVGKIEFFDWTTKKVQNRQYRMLAEEWNRLGDTINRIRSMIGRSTFSFTEVEPNDEFTAAIFNEVRNALNKFGLAESLPSTKSTDDDINASYMNDIKDYTNAAITEHTGGNNNIDPEQINVGIQNLHFTFTEV